MKQRIDPAMVLRSLLERKAMQQAIADSAAKAATETVATPNAELFVDAVPPLTAAELAAREPRQPRRRREAKPRPTLPTERLSEVTAEPLAEPAVGALAGVVGGLVVHSNRKRWYCGSELYGPWLPETVSTYKRRR